jgi:hypothetical protein
MYIIYIQYDPRLLWRKPDNGQSAETCSFLVIANKHLNWHSCVWLHLPSLFSPRTTGMTPFKEIVLFLNNNFEFGTNISDMLNKKPCLTKFENNTHCETWKRLLYYVTLLVYKDDVWVHSLITTELVLWQGTGNRGRYGLHHETSHCIQQSSRWQFCKARFERYTKTLSICGPGLYSPSCS